MKMAATLCDDCGTSYDSFDNYCRSCGANLRVRRLPALLADRRMSRPGKDSSLSTLVTRSIMALVATKLVGWGVRFAARKVFEGVVLSRLQPQARPGRATRRAQVVDADPAQEAAPGAPVATLTTHTVQQLYVNEEAAPPPPVKKRWLFPVR